LSKQIYYLTLQEPLATDYCLKDQMRGSSGAIMDNIAEGFGRGSRLEFINCLTVAK
jgi:four helix bundle protein